MSSNQQKSYFALFLEAIRDFALFCLRAFATTFGFLLACGAIGGVLGGITGLVYGFPIVAAALVGAVLGVAFAILVHVMPWWDI